MLAILIFRGNLPLITELNGTEPKFDKDRFDLNTYFVFDPPGPHHIMPAQEIIERFDIEVAPSTIGIWILKEKGLPS